MMYFVETDEIDTLAYRIDGITTTVKYNHIGDTFWSKSYLDKKSIIRGTDRYRQVPNTYFALTGQVL
jgi:hypothetical protein